MPPRPASRPRQVTPEELAAVDAYRTFVIPEDRWLGIRSFVNELTRDYLPYTREATGHVQLTIARYVDWAHNTAGRDLTRDALLDPELIVYFVRNHLDGMSASTKQQNRANLLRLVDCIMPERRRLLNVRSYGKQDSAAPFTPDDLPMILRWPMEQRTAYRRFNAAVLVHFILGAGLRHSELIHVTREDVVEDDLGVVVHVREGSNPRQVPVLGAHEDAVVVLAESVAPGSRIYRSDQKTVKVSVASAWIHATFTSCLGRQFNPQQARATWIVGHLDRGVSADALIRAAGMTSYTGLQRYLAHTTRVDEAAVRWELSRREYARKKGSDWWEETAPYRAARNEAGKQRRRARERFRRGVT